MANLLNWIMDLIIALIVMVALLWVAAHWRRNTAQDRRHSEPEAREHGPEDDDEEDGRFAW